MSVDKRVKEIEDKWKRIRELLPPDSKKPLDAFTRVEFQEKFGLSRNQAKDRLVWMLKAGSLERGGTGSRVWYRLKEGK